MIHIMCHSLEFCLNVIVWLIVSSIINSIPGIILSRVKKLAWHTWQRIMRNGYKYFGCISAVLVRQSCDIYLKRFLCHKLTVMREWFDSWQHITSEEYNLKTWSWKGGLAKIILSQKSSELDSISSFTFHNAYWNWSDDQWDGKTHNPASCFQGLKIQI